MKSIKSFFYLAFILFTILSCSNSTESDSLKVLFIGNSYTYYNSSPELLKALIREKFPKKPIEIQLISQGGMTLKRHWEEGRAVEVIKSNDWDYVILQEQSKLGMGLIIDNDIYFGQTDHFYEYATKFDTEIKKIGAQTAFFMTWSVKQRPEEQKILTHAYSTIAKELNAKLIPVGLVWDKVRNQAKFDLYDLDGSHPSAYGSYLVATSIFSALLEESPLGLSGVISGLQLSSTGEPSLDSQPLVDISETDAQTIQKTSWKVVEDIRKKGGYIDINKPKQKYVLPKLTEGDVIDTKEIEGRWYGTSTYSNNYLGVILDVENIENSLEAKISFYSPNGQDKMFVTDVELKDKQLNMILIDSLRTMSSNLNFYFNNKKLNGLSKSFGGDITNYKHWNLSRLNNQNGLDLEALDVLITAFNNDIESKGYVKAAINYYKKYSSLIGKSYLPEEAYLNAVGYNFVEDGKVDEALNIFELAMILYPESVNTYDSYGETLIKAGEFEKGLSVYTKGYELAKKTGNENATYMEANLKRFKEGKSKQRQTELLPPPPPTGI
ncbi:SGNH/GDSL hydrolase family protein [Pontimicrobium aquaticum]|uniref:Uncharacterized protein n=1 Tax=Pontimicrobium aquaticum TaxID=2565367 RepID=A0A4U0F0Y0_9FLAO|nr:SGNH/GDSL hydrolase family protein [Pontimicrobium aquaticum]TJY36292.1 hypothetical protein E5167_06390 [Pontimicrobium aquaticum]